MDILSLISGDSLFKYSFTMGLALFALSIVYPMQKKHALELEEVEYYRELTLLKNDYSTINKVIAEHQVQSKRFNSLKDSMQYFDEQKRNRIKSEYLAFESAIDSTVALKEKLKLKKIETDYTERKQKTLKNQIQEFEGTLRLMKLTGIILSLFGFIFWLSSTFWNYPKKHP